MSNETNNNNKTTTKRVAIYSHAETSIIERSLSEVKHKIWTFGGNYGTRILNGTTIDGYSRYGELLTTTRVIVDKHGFVFFGKTKKI